LKKIYRVVDIHWAEICDSLALVEELSEDSNFEGREIAAAVASKCFYHLQEYNDSLRLALSAGPYFNIFEKSEYINTLLSKCIDEYTELRLRKEKDPSAHIEIDPRMESIIEQMFQRCYSDNCFDQAMGIALDTRRLDKVEEVLVAALANGHESILRYTFNLCQGARNIPSREFRLSVIDLLVKFYGTLAEQTMPTSATVTNTLTARLMLLKLSGNYVEDRRRARYKHTNSLSICKRPRIKALC
jgi:26S proteasome regulatory subunit N2